MLLASCTTQDDHTIIRLGHGLDPTHPIHQALVEMQRETANLSGGKLEIKIYPSAQLGGEREMLELLQLGSLGMVKVSSAVLEGFDPAFSVLSVPYLFSSEAHRFDVLEGEVGLELLHGLDRFWLRGLTFFDAGSRSFYTKERPVSHPDDLTGLKIRTMESASQIRMVNELGGSATPISWGELYSALQQGIVDGAENNLPSFYTSRHFEVCRYLTLDEHTAIPDVLLISLHVWEGLTAQEQEWISEAARRASDVQKVLWREATQTALDGVIAAGVEVVRPDKTPFRDRMDVIYERYRESDPQVFSLIGRIQEADTVSTAVTL